MERKKIFANNISDKGLIFEICKEFIQLNTKKEKKLQTIHLQNGQRT